MVRIFILLALVAQVAYSQAPACLFYATVQPGDTCWSIATNKCRQSLAEIYAAPSNSWLNNGAACNNLQVKQTICCPSFNFPGSCKKTYEVRSGDTCWGISQFYGISLDTFLSFNRGINCNNLQIGQFVCGGVWLLYSTSLYNDHNILCISFFLDDYGLILFAYFKIRWLEYKIKWLKLWQLFKVLFRSLKRR